MEVKKNPKADLTRKTGFFFSIALLITMSIVLTAFEWKQHELAIADLVQRNADVFEEMDVVATEILPPPPPVMAAPIIVAVSDDVIIDEIPPIIDITPTDAGLPPIEVKPIEIPEEPTDEPFSIVESPASFNGGVDAFYARIGKDIVYPPQARRMGIEGKVFVEFVVNRDGSIAEVKAIKGIGAGCDEEAVRVIKNSPSWNPGKQRGKPVRQKMVVPITFRLH